MKTIKEVELEEKNRELQDRINRVIEEIVKRSTKELADYYINILKGKE